MLLTCVESMILRNQLALLRSEIRLLNGRIDGEANRDRIYLRERIYATAEALGMDREEML